MSGLLNFLMFQLGWFASVLMGAGDWHWLAPGVVLLILLVHLSTSADRAAEQKLMAYALAFGLVWENLVSVSGLVIYPSGQPFGQLAPAWILAMWPLLAITLNVSLRWLKGRYLLAALFGAIGGPLAFLAGERLGAVVFPDTGLTMIVLAVGWATLFPLLMRLSQRYDGFERRLNTSLEVSR
ncbi:MAG: DUF2878 domain-containing protein [Gammaproteobacteria bacterium]|nr:DUF2878 domain-containing protein [Gammaproteobacteria bacterium]